MKNMDLIQAIIKDGVDRIEIKNAINDYLSNEYGVECGNWELLAVLESIIEDIRDDIKL